MNQTCHFGYEGHMQICCSSIMQSKGGGSQKLTFVYRGKGEVWRGAKSAHAVFEQPLRICLTFLGASQDDFILGMNDDLCIQIYQGQP